MMTNSVCPFNTHIKYRNDHYQIGSLIGEGTSKTVYQATSAQGMKIAVLYQRVMDENQARNELNNLEACREIHGVIQLLKEPIFFCEEDGECYIELVTPLCDQGTLIPWIKGKTLRDRLRIFLHVTKTTQKLHQKGLAHGDLKSTNLAIQTNQGVPEPIIIDLGCARKQNDQSKEEKSSKEFKLTGSPAYLPPQLEECENDLFARDIFALGAILYEIVSYNEICGKLMLDVSQQTGREANAIAYLFNTKQEEINAAIENLDAARPIKQLLKKMLVLKPKNRCSIDEIIKNLTEILNFKDAILDRCSKKPVTPTTPLLLDFAKPRFPVV